MLFAEGPASASISPSAVKHVGRPRRVRKKKAGDAGTILAFSRALRVLFALFRGIGHLYCVPVADA